VGGVAKEWLARGMTANAPSLFNGRWARILPLHKPLRLLSTAVLVVYPL